MSQASMVKSSILCPGTPTIVDKDNNPITHYLMRDPSRENGELVCSTGGCKFMYRKNEVDVWQSDYIPNVIPIPL